MSRDQISRKYTPLIVSTGGAENAGVENAGAYRRDGKCRREYDDSDTLSRFERDNGQTDRIAICLHCSADAR